MNCRPPQILSLPYMKSGVPSAQVDRYVLDSFSSADELIAAVEIDASSELDCCIVTHQGGDAFVAVGAPALGPFTGPLLVKPWRRVMPFSNDGQGFNSEPLTTNPPRLALKVHYQTPAVFQERRAPCVRTAPDADPVGAAYAPVAEFPLYGRASARILLSAGNNAVTFRIKGKCYTAARGGLQGDPVGWNASAASVLLTLDGSGSTELTLAGLDTTSITFVGEPWEVLVLELKSALGSQGSGFTYEASGEI